MTVFGRLISRAGARRRVTLAVVTTVALTGTVGMAGLFSRDKIGERFATGAGKRLGRTPSVDLGATPAQWQLARGSFPDVGLTADDVTVRRMSKLGIDAHLHQVRRSSHTVTVRSTTVDVDVPAASLVDGALQGLGGVVAPGPETGQLIVRIGPAGALTVPVTPTLHGDTIRAVPGRPTFDGAPLPGALAHKVTDRAERSVELTGLPLALEPRRLAVTDDGLRLTLRGGPAVFHA
ncbi:LmeA family phospholipid-binding protein [Streptomyces sp. NPDC001393]